MQQWKIILLDMHFSMSKINGILWKVRRRHGTVSKTYTTIATDCTKWMFSAKFKIVRTRNKIFLNRCEVSNI